MAENPKDLIRQLDNADLQAVAKLCEPHFDQSPVTLRRDIVLSLLNEIFYHRQVKQAGVLEIRNIVSMRDKKSYVQLTWGSSVIQLSTAEAIEHARRLLHVAAGADADAFLIWFLKERVGIDDQQKANAVLADFREYRQRVLGQKFDDDL
jgi:hypothetical protein